jgi:hypothetical protein
MYVAIPHVVAADVTGRQILRPAQSPQFHLEMANREHNPIFARNFRYCGSSDRKIRVAKRALIFPVAKTL